MRTPATICLCFLTLLLLPGCTFRRAAQIKAQTKVQANTTALTEERRAMITGAADALPMAPTNPPVTLATQFVKRAQQIDGLPERRIPVEAILAQNKEAIADLDQRFQLQQRLLDDRAELKRQLDAANAHLVEMGKLYEAEKNRSIIKRIWHWAVGTLGFAGLIALIVLCPAVLPVLGSLVGWIIGKLPRLAGVAQVVGKKAFDGVVAGVGSVREHLKALETHQPDKTMTAAEVRKLLDTQLLIATDADHRALIDARRRAVHA